MKIRRRTNPSSIDGTDREKPPWQSKGSTPFREDNKAKRPSSAERHVTWELRCYGAALLSGSIALALLLRYWGYHMGPAIPTIVMVIAALLSEKETVRLNPHTEISVGFLPGLFTAVALGPISAMIVAAGSLLGDLRRPIERWAIWTGSRCLVLGFAALMASIPASGSALQDFSVAAALASATVVIGESMAGAVTLKIRRSNSVSECFIRNIRITSIGILVYIPVIAGLAYVYELVSPWAVVLFIGPAIAAQRFFILYKEQIKTSDELNNAVRQLEKVNLSFATVLVAALDARDHYTAGHSAAVAVYARDIAKHLALSDEEVRRSHLCGLLHDIGKIGVPTGVLEKRGPLVSDERMAIETHAEVGASILERIEGYEEIALAVRHHHERFSGGGYPDQISGDEIPLLARLVAVADAYSAMTSERPYRVALSGAEALARIEREAGKQFDPRVVNAFVIVLEQASEAYTSGADRDFEVELAELAAFEPGSPLAVSS